MSFFRFIALGLRSLFRKVDVDRELNEELETFLEKMHGITCPRCSPSSPPFC